MLKRQTATTRGGRLVGLLNWLLKKGFTPIGRDCESACDVSWQVQTNLRSWQPCSGQLGELWSRRTLHTFRELVRMRGLEPPRGYPRSHLKAVRLPISPHPHSGCYFFPGAGGAGAGLC